MLKAKINFIILNMKVMGDERGKLVALESNRNIPFDIKRVYYIFDTLLNVERGKHAHKNLEQVVVALHGSCKFVLDDGKKKEEVLLDSPEIALYIGKNIWRTMKDFSRNCVLMILASDYYNENEYIRDYDEFLKKVKCEEI